MPLTFENLIEHNKRVSWALVLVLALFLAIVCGVFSLALSDASEFDPLLHFSFGALIGFSIATVGAGFSYYFGGSLVTAISDAYSVERSEDLVLWNVVEEISIAAGVPMPKIYAIDDDSPNAFATGRDPEHSIICITTGLRKKLNREELQAVIAHEMAHVKNYDILLMMLVSVFAGVIVLVSDLFLRRFGDLIRFRGGRAASGEVRKSSGFPLAAIFLVVALLFAWLSPILARLLQLSVSREREYLADATGVKFCRNPLALASALEKIALDDSVMHNLNRATEHMYIVNPSPDRRLTAANRDSIWSTHPPLIKRIARLRAIAGEMHHE